VEDAVTAVAAIQHPRRLAFGLKLHEQGRYQRAERVFGSLDRPHRPNLEARYYQALALREAGQTAQAIPLLETVVADRPEWTEAHWHLGYLLDSAGRRADAEAQYRATLALDGAQPSAWLNLGNVLAARAAFEEAIDCYQRARQLVPGAPRPLINLAHTKLLLGQYAEGWRLYHERWSLPDFRARNGLPGGQSSKGWTGQSVSGKRLLVFREQGTGDVIQMLRYDGMLRALGAEVTWRVPAHLFRLTRASVPSEVVTDVEPLPSHDYLVPVMSLPLFCGTDDVSKIPRAEGYLGMSLPTTLPSQFTVGVAWAGSPHHKRDRERSIGVEAMAGLFSVPGVRFVNLQFGPRESEGDAYGLERVDVSDYQDTAHLLRTLNLVIACDTSIVHLAGAMGVPCWTLVTHPPDWRWGLEREDSPWYASVRILRQLSLGDWAPVVAEARERLTILTARAA
jgi:Flp pilus assembly protein TadD